MSAYNLNTKTTYGVFARYKDESNEFSESSPVAQVIKQDFNDANAARIVADFENKQDERQFPRESKYAKQFVVVKVTTTFEEIG